MLLFVSVTASYNQSWTTPSLGLDVAFFETNANYTMTNQTFSGDTLSGSIYFSTTNTSIYMAGAGTGSRASGTIDSTSTTLYIYDNGDLITWNDMGCITGSAGLGDSGGVIYTASDKKIVGIVMGGFGGPSYYYTSAVNILLECDILPYS